MFRLNGTPFPAAGSLQLTSCNVADTDVSNHKQMCTKSSIRVISYDVCET